MGTERWPTFWPRSLTGRLALTYLLTTLAIVGTLSLSVYFLTRHYLADRLQRQLDAQADFYAVYAAGLAPNATTLRNLAPTIVTFLAPQANLNVRLFAASSGTLLAATQDIGPRPSGAALAALRYRSPALFTQSSYDQPDRRYAARPILVADGTLIGVVEVSRTTQDSQAFLHTLATILSMAGVLAALASVGVSYTVARRVTQPIHELERVTGRIASGDLSARLASYPSDEVGRLAESVNRMAAQLQEAETARQQFISSIAHDLRTPLTAIKGFLVNLIDETAPEHQQPLLVIEQETDRLIRLVNELLDWSRIQSGGLRLERGPVDAGQVVRAAVALAQGRARHLGISLSANVAPDLPTIHSDGDRLQRVVVNLLDNALKFTPSGGRVEIRATGDGKTLTLSVTDTGRGMSIEEQRRAFEPYYRGEGGGTGLGLTTARAIIRAHGGEMWVESEQGQGTTITFTVPIVKPEPVPG